MSYPELTTVRGPLALTGGRIALPDTIVMGHALVIQDELIQGIAGEQELAADIERLDVGGRLITPGLIDIHTHGALGHTFNEPVAEAWTTITAENVRRGVTSLLATLAAAPIPDLVTCLEFARSWMAIPAGRDTKRDESRHVPGTYGARVLGVHLESPYISPAQKGALDPTAIRRPDDGTVDALLAFADVLRIFVLAPEQPGAQELVQRLIAAGIMPAAGHTSATDAQVAEAMTAGLHHITHIWSAMSSTVRHGPWRKPGVLEAALVFDGLNVEMIDRDDTDDTDAYIEQYM